MIRKATDADLPALLAVYAAIFDAEEAGRLSTGWLRGVYPSQETLTAALSRDDLFVYECDGEVVGSMVINRKPVDVYRNAPWTKKVLDDEVMVLHTLAVLPSLNGQGIGRRMVAFYEAYAKENGSTALRLDTNRINTRARRLYQSFGYTEIATVPTVFNGIPGVELVLLEKSL